MAELLLVVRHGGEIGEVRSAWYGGDFWVFLGTFFGFMGMLHCGMVVCGDVFMGCQHGLQQEDQFVAGFVKILTFFFFNGLSFGFEICSWFDLILGWIFFVGSWWWS